MHTREFSTVEEFNQAIQKNKQKVMFKNAIMQVWSKIKEERSGKSISEMV